MEEYGPVQVSVVVPTRDRLPLLRRTLRGILGQRDVEVEVLVVDDGSADGTPDGVRQSYGGAGVRVLRTDRPGRGPSVARNVGLAAGRGEWTAFCDDDDVWAPDKLAAQLAAAAATGGGERADWVLCGHVGFDEAGRVASAMRPPATPADVRQQAAVNVVPGGASGLLVRTPALREVGGFDETAWALGDYALGLRLVDRPAALVDRPLVGYRLQVPGRRASMSTLTGLSRSDEQRLRPAMVAAQARLGVEPDWTSWERMWGLLEVRSGARARAARTFLGVALARRDPAEAARALLALAAPQVLQRRWDAYDRAHVPVEYRREAEAWLPAALRIDPL